MATPQARDISLSPDRVSAIDYEPSPRCDIISAGGALMYRSIFSIVLGLVWVGTARSAEMLVGNPSRYQAVSTEMLAQHVRQLHSTPPSWDELQSQSAAVHGATLVSEPKMEPVVNTAPNGIPSAIDLILPPPAPIEYEREGMDAPISIVLTDSDRDMHFNPREVRQIKWVLDRVPVEFLKGIASIEPERYSGATSTIKLAEWQGPPIIVYAPPMVKDTLPYAILLHSQNSAQPS